MKMQDKWAVRFESILTVLMLIAAIAGGCALFYYAAFKWMMRDILLTKLVLVFWKTDPDIAQGLSVFSSVSEIIGPLMLGLLMVWQVKRLGGKDALRQTASTIITVTAWFVMAVSVLDLASNIWGEYLEVGLALVPLAIAAFLLTLSEYFAIAGAAVCAISVWYLIEMRKGEVPGLGEGGP